MKVNAKYVNPFIEAAMKVVSKITGIDRARHNRYYNRHINRHSDRSVFSNETGHIR